MSLQRNTGGCLVDMCLQSDTQRLAALLAFADSLLPVFPSEDGLDQFAVISARAQAPPRPRAFPILALLMSHLVSNEAFRLWVQKNSPPGPYFDAQIRRISTIYGAWLAAGTGSVADFVFECINSILLHC